MLNVKYQCLPSIHNKNTSCITCRVICPLNGCRGAGVPGCRGSQLAWSLRALSNTGTRVYMYIAVIILLL